MYKIPATSLFLGKNLVYLPECQSTNDLALQMAQQGNAPEGTLVITDHQTAGRGQRGNHWEAPRGQNFTLSFVVKPTFLPIRDQFQLTIAIALGIADYIGNTLRHNVHIKWPNDILVNGSKICGILIENHLQGTLYANAIVGVGLNVNQSVFQTATATSMAMESGHTLSLADELEPFLVAIEKRYLQLRRGDQKGLLDDYLGRLFWRGEERPFRTGDTEFNGTINGIDDRGRLLIETSGEIRAFDLKEVAYGYKR